MLRKAFKTKYEEKPKEEDKRPKKRIVNLSKNVMSIALPYLTHDELLKAEACNKQMAIFVNFWPVWKNIYFE